jgi:hypothetical protein
MNDIFTRRFDELAKQLEGVIASRYQTRGLHDAPVTKVDHEKFLQWKVSAKNLLAKACGLESTHIEEFDKQENAAALTNYSKLTGLGAVFIAAKEDYAGGYLRSAKSLIQADLFGSELEQAQALLDAGYISAAAVIAGVVLETALRGLCDKAGIPHGKADKMNADLAKNGTYNCLKQKRVVALLAVRNSAAHGKTGEFTKNDVESMIPDVGGFVADYL